MTDYRNLIPPVGEDHIEYALKRVGHSAARIRARNVNEVTIVSAHATGGAPVQIVMKKPVDPYYSSLPASNDTEAWHEVKRVIHRFPIQEVLNHLFPSGISNDFTDIDGLTALLNAGGLGLTSADYKYSLQHDRISITITNATTLLGYGTGEVLAVEPEEIEGPQA